MSLRYATNWLIKYQVFGREHWPKEISRGDGHLQHRCGVSDVSIEFLVMAFVVCILPGTGVIYTLAIGLGRGFGSAVVAALGCTFGIVPHAVASVVGIAAVLQTSALAFQIVQWAGVGYLFYMAWGVLRDNGASAVSEKTEPISGFRLIRDGIFLNVLNPKLSLFFLAFLPQFVPPTTVQPTLTMIFLALVFMAMTFAVFIIYGACASVARDHVITRPSAMIWLRRSFAGAFILLGLRLALGSR